MLARTRSGTLVGTEAVGVDVEAHLGKGLPGLDLVGLPEAAVREARVRVRTALASGGYALPPRHIVLSLAPADVRKSGAALDVAIAVALLAATGGCAPGRLEETLLVGELSLGGELRPVRGVLAQLAAARDRGLVRAVVPAACAEEAALASGIDVRVADRLADVVAFLDGRGALGTAAEAAGLARTGAGVAYGAGTDAVPCGSGASGDDAPDLADVRGQGVAKRACEIAAAGGHALLFIGSPGAGKTMLARRLPGLLPTPAPDEAHAIAAIAGVAGLRPPLRGGVCERPFRAPHHTASEAALVGGGDPIRPGEVTLAHLGVLFLDELPEFRRPAIESLRTTMELGAAVVVRARQRVVMPARPLVVAAMNPCPCGYEGDRRRVCTCPPRLAAAYRARVSGPLLDRFDLQVRLEPVRAAALRAAADGERSADVRARVEAARRFATERARHAAGDELGRVTAGVRPGALRLLEAAVERMGLSARAFTKVLRVARTIADLAGCAEVGEAEVAEAIGYRALDVARAATAA
jgi:magnesium chelatase family protein